MKNNFTSALFPFVLILLVSVSSCDEESDPEPEEKQTMTDTGTADQLVCKISKVRPGNSEFLAWDFEYDSFNRIISLLPAGNQSSISMEVSYDSNNRITEFEMRNLSTFIRIFKLIEPPLYNSENNIPTKMILQADNGDTYEYNLSVVNGRITGNTVYLGRGINSKFSSSLKLFYNGDGSLLKYEGKYYDEETGDLINETFQDELVSDDKRNPWVADEALMLFNLIRGNNILLGTHNVIAKDFSQGEIINKNVYRDDDLPTDMFLDGRIWEFGENLNIEYICF